MKNFQSTFNSILFTMSDDKMIKEEVIDVVNWNCAEDNVVQQQQGEAEDGDEDSDVDVDRKWNTYIFI